MGNSDGLLQDERCRFVVPPEGPGGCYFCAFAPGFQPPILHLAKLIWHLCWTTTTRSVSGEDLPAIPGRSPGTEASTPVRAVETKRISRPPSA